VCAAGVRHQAGGADHPVVSSPPPTLSQALLPVWERGQAGNAAQFFSVARLWNGITSLTRGCRRRQTASARASLPLSAAPDPWRSATAWKGETPLKKEEYWSDS
jgi:hypothetical protein